MHKCYKKILLDSKISELSRSIQLRSAICPSNTLFGA